MKALRLCLNDRCAPFKQGEIGPDLFRHACLLGLEGLVSKHRESTYRGGPSDRWIKVKNRKHPASGRVLDQFLGPLDGRPQRRWICCQRHG